MTVKLINGKNPLERIVSLEVNNSTAELFIQNLDGSIKSEFVPNHFWILSDQQHGKDWIRLKGDLHYKYGRQFQDKKDFYSVKQSLRHEDIYLINDAKEAFMINKGFTYFKGLKLEDVSILSFDIETTGLEHNDTSKVLLISNTFRNHNGIERKLFSYDDYNDEGEMIDDWCKWVREKDPSVLAGHNINSFDLPYLNFIANKYDTKLYLGRNNTPLKFNTYESKFRKDGTQFYHYFKAKIYGREIVDTMFLSIKYDVGRKYESYGLKSIIKYEGLEVKDRVFYDASKIRFNYTNKIEWAKIKEYAMHDADDALALYDLMAPPLFYSTQMIPKSFQLVTESAEGSKINSMMIRAYLQDGHSLPKESDRVDFVGAISLGNVGIYRNVSKVDVASLYPSIMIQYEVYDKDKDPSGYFLELVKTLTDERLKNKALSKETGNSYYKDMEQSQKVLINSCYGFLAATGLLFNSPKNASFITEKGREILTQAMEWAKSKELSLVNADTDSISFSRADQSFISKIERRALLDDLNGNFPDRIRFTDDGYYKCLVVIKAKNYIMQLEDGTVKIKGSSLKDQKKEPALLEFIRDIIDCILAGNSNYTEIYLKYVKEIKKLENIKRWATKRTITDKVLSGTRANETKVKDAIENSEYVEGDKVYMYYNANEELKLVENFNNDHHIDRLLEKLYKTAMTFDTIISKENFLNFKLKRNKEALNAL